MRCYFCGVKIHFYEEFWVLDGFYFHVATITADAVRCKRVHVPALVKAEIKLERKGGKSP